MWSDIGDLVMLAIEKFIYFAKRPIEYKMISPNVKRINKKRDSFVLKKNRVSAKSSIVSATTLHGAGVA